MKPETLRELLEPYLDLPLVDGTSKIERPSVLDPNKSAATGWCVYEAGPFIDITLTAILRATAEKPAKEAV